MRYFIGCLYLTILGYVIRRIHGLLIDHIEVVSVCAFHLRGLHVGNGRWLELGVHDLQRVTHHIVRLGKRTERGQYLIIDVLSQQNFVERVLESVPGLVLLWLIIFGIVNICEGLLYLGGRLFSKGVVCCEKKIHEFRVQRDDVLLEIVLDPSIVHLVITLALAIPIKEDGEAWKLLKASG